MSDKNWLKNLKKGYKVIIRRHGYGGVTYQFAKVDGVTPKTQILKVGTQKFRQSDGWEVTLKSFYGPSSCLIEHNAENAGIAIRTRDISRFREIVCQLYARRQLITTIQVDKYLYIVESLLNEVEEAARKVQHDD
jgi:hypothetical protein